MKYVVIDLEMNRISKEYRKEDMICGMETIEIGAVVLDDKYQEVGCFKTLVKPQYNSRIEKKYTKLTGITTEMVQDAPAFEDALKMFFSWCRSINDDLQIYQWSENDIEQILREIVLKNISIDKDDFVFIVDWKNFQKEYGDLLHFKRDVSLKDAVTLAGISFEGRAHDALFDARNTAKLLRTVNEPALYKKALEKVEEALNPKPLCSTLGDLFDFKELMSACM